MQFPIVIPIVGGASADANPRSAAGSVPDRNIGEIAPCVHNTDVAPKSLLMALEGTASQTAIVQMWVLDEDPRTLNRFGDDPGAGRAERKWYQYGDAITVTVGNAQLVAGVAGADVDVALPCPVGKVYFQVTTKPASNADLKVGWLGG